MRRVPFPLFGNTQTLTWMDCWGSKRAVAVLAAAVVVAVASGSPLASFSVAMAMGRRLAGRTLVDTLPFYAWQWPAPEDLRPDCVVRRCALLVKGGSKGVKSTLYYSTGPGQGRVQCSTT